MNAIITHAEALKRITAAIADGVEPEWQAGADALVAFLSTDGEYNTSWTDHDLRGMVESATGVKLDLELSLVARDIIGD